MTYTDAKATCAKMGARVCGAVELDEDVAVTKCKIGRKRVWTSTECGDGKVLTQGATSKLLSTIAKQCVSVDRKLPFKCCADFKDFKEFSDFVVTVETGKDNKDSVVKASFSWPAYRKARVSYKIVEKTGKKKWITPKETKNINLDSQGQGVAELYNLRAGYQYAIRVTPIIQKRPVNKQSHVEKIFLRKNN